MDIAAYLDSLPSTGVITIPGTKIRSRWLTLTPEIAQVFMEVNIDNRTKREKHLERITSDMAEGRYEVTHQGVAFDDQDHLIDGQHRCTAIINSGEAQWTLVTDGLHERAKRVIDNNAKRATQDFMPGQHRPTRSAAIRLYLAAEATGFEISTLNLKQAIQTVTNTMVQDNWDRWGRDQLTTWCQYAKLASRHLHVPSGPLTAAVMFYPDVAMDFLEGLANMSGLPNGDPRLALLKYRGPQNQRRITTYTAAIAAAKCIKAFNEHSTIGILRVHTAEVVKLYARPAAEAENKSHGREGQGDPKAAS